jgi:hypothetical protein
MDADEDLFRLAQFDRGYQPEVKAADEKRREAIACLMAFGKTHGLTLGGMSIRELLEEARP